MTCLATEAIAIDRALDKARWILETFLPQRLAEYRAIRGISIDDLPDPLAYRTVDLLTLDDSQEFAIDQIPAVAVYPRAETAYDESGICGIDHEYDLDVSAYGILDGRTLESAARRIGAYASVARSLLVELLPDVSGEGAIWNAQVQSTPDLLARGSQQDVWILRTTRWMRVTLRAERPAGRTYRGVTDGLFPPLAQEQAELRAAAEINGDPALPGRLIEIAPGALTVALPVPDGTMLRLVDQVTGAQTLATFAAGEATVSPAFTDDRLWTLTAQTAEGALWSAHGRFEVAPASDAAVYDEGVYEPGVYL